MKVFPFRPMTIESERLEFKTSVTRCPAGEQRAALRKLPRSIFPIKYAFNRQEFAQARNFFDGLFDGLGDGSLLLPLWVERQKTSALEGQNVLPVDATVAHFVVGGQLFLWQSNSTWSTHTVSAIAPGEITLAEPLEADITGVYVMPLVEAISPVPLVTERNGAETIMGKASFLVQGLPDVASNDLYPEYLSHPVVIDKNVAVSPVSERLGHEVAVFDSGVGLVGQSALFDAAKAASVMTWDVQSAADHWALRQWLLYCRGKCRAFWLPSWGKDFELTDDAEVDDDALLVKTTWRADLENNDFHIMVVLNSGAVSYHRVTDVLTWNVGREKLILERPVPGAINAADVRLISLLTFSRFDSDRYEIQHRPCKFPQRAARISLPVVNCPVI